MGSQEVSTWRARINRAKAIGLQRPVLAAVLCALVFATRSGAQVPEATAFAQRAEALQGALAAWQKSLNAMALGQAPLSRPSLGNRQAQCLEWVPTIRIVIARVRKNPALGQQFSLLSSLTFFDNTLLNLEDALQLALAAEPSAADRAAMEQDQEKVDAIRKELHGFYADLSSQLFQQLHAAAQNSPTEGAAASHQPGEISGHVFRSDTGKPLADAIVTLESPGSPQSDRLQRTAEDGSYEFAGLAPGNYWVIAYRSGFVGSVYGVGKSQNASEGLISVASGQKRADIDFRLSPAPEITTLSGKALAGALPEGAAPLTYGPGSFSPDGKQFAFVVAGPNLEQVCLYDLFPQGSRCVTAHAGWGPPGSKAGAIGSLAWTGGALYAQPPATGGPILRVLPPQTRREPGPPPSSAAARRAFIDHVQAMQRLFRERQNRIGEAGFHLVGSNGNFRVTAWYGQLAVAAPDGSDPFNIASGGKELYNFIFDPKRSLVYYPVPGRYFGAIVTFDPTVRRYRTTALPFGEGLKLLDVKREGGTTLAAYTVDGPCVPKALADGEDSWILPAKPLPAAQPASVCLATIPAGPRN
jgi:hypothetical protein